MNPRPDLSNKGSGNGATNRSTGSRAWAQRSMSKSPKSDPPMPSTYGIYELDGDQLQICMGNHGKRPERFGGRMGTVTAIYRLTRK